jgi:hypothetical protein
VVVENVTEVLATIERIAMANRIVCTRRGISRIALLPLRRVSQQLECGCLPKPMDVAQGLRTLGLSLPPIVSQERQVDREWRNSQTGSCSKWNQKLGVAPQVSLQMRVI